MTRTILNFASTIGMGTISVLVTIIIILNFLSGIVGGIWLAILGHWGSIGWGFGLGFIMPWAFTIASLPAMGLGVLLAFLMEKGSKTFTAIIGFSTSLYSNVLMAAWVIFVFGFFMGRADSKSFIPYLLWGYSAMMAPLAYMASKEPPDSVGTSMGVLFSQLCYFVWVMHFFFGKNVLPWLYTIIGIGITFSLFATVMVVAMMIHEYREKNRMEEFETEKSFFDIDDDNDYEDGYVHNGEYDD